MRLLARHSSELLAGILLLALAFLLVNPFDLLMLDYFAMMTLGALLVVYAVFVGMVWRESARDEREATHQGLVGRVAYLIGSAIIVLGIVTEIVVMHEVNFWLVAALSGMVGAKIVASLYYRNYH